MLIPINFGFANGSKTLISSINPLPENTVLAMNAI